MSVHEFICAYVSGDAMLVAFSPHMGVTLTRDGHVRETVVLDDEDEARLLKILHDRSPIKVVEVPRAFVAGDWVECVDAAPYGAELTNGRIYRVLDAGYNTIIPVEGDYGYIVQAYSHRFKLYQHAFSDCEYLEAAEANANFDYYQTCAQNAVSA